VNKADRKMFLFNNQRVLNDYDVDLGFAPIGDKFFEGDGRTPEGNYFIDRRNPNSKFHLSIGISYPNAEDRAEAKALGKPPGGDIFIHGKSNPLKRKRDDWTWGCIAVPNDEIELIYAMVKNGTPIQINP
jgi:murein L,D-transpeptidase YafK